MISRIESDFSRNIREAKRVYGAADDLEDMRTIVVNMLSALEFTLSVVSPGGFARKRLGEIQLDQIRRRVEKAVAMARSPYDPPSMATDAIQRARAAIEGELGPMSHEERREFLAQIARSL